jgi:hypothetical protein
MMDTYKFLADEDEAKFFWDYCVPPLQKNELYFISLSARNKQLSEEERKYYLCGRSEMFAKQQIRHDSFVSFLQHLKRFEVRRDAYLTKAGIPYPDKVLVCYWNICPIDAMKAMKDQMAYLTEVMGGLTDAALKNSQGGIEDGFYKVRKSFDTCQSLFARNFGHKEWLDIDCDFTFTDTAYQAIRGFFNEKGFGENVKPGQVMFVRTAGGLHCLIRKSELHMNPAWICEQIGKITGGKEIIVNKNEMIPTPSTLQYGDHIVRVLNKEDFIGKVEPFKHGED